MIRAAICDDDSVMTQKIQELLQKEFAENEAEYTIDIYDDALLFVEALGKGNYDVVFLDIEMPVLNGMQVAEYCRKLKQEPYLFFVTQREEYVFESFQFHPFRFWRKEKMQEEAGEDIKALVRDIRRNRYQCNFILGQREEIIEISQIMYIEKIGKKLIVHMTTGDELSFRDSINKRYEELEQYGFIMIHSGCIINAAYIVYIKQEIICLQDGSRHIISRRRIAEVKESFHRYIRLYK